MTGTARCGQCGTDADLHEAMVWCLYLCTQCQAAEDFEIEYYLATEWYRP